MSSLCLCYQLCNCECESRYVFFDFQISTSVQQTSLTVMSMLSVITLRDLITAHVALDTLEMEHHAMVIIKDT